jgi:hypothetical protein
MAKGTFFKNQSKNSAAGGVMVQHLASPHTEKGRKQRQETMQPHMTALRVSADSCFKRAAAASGVSLARASSNVS